LRHPDGSKVSTDVEMRALARDFYHSLYSLEGANNMDAILDLVEPLVSDQMNDKLLTNF
jgi:hypothetical protein